MNAPQTRQRPAGTGREVEKQIELEQQLYGHRPADSTAARDGYHGTRPPVIAPAPRNTATVAVDLAAAATRLRAIAGGIRLGGPMPDALAEADRTIAGIGGLLRELRQGARS